MTDADGSMQGLPHRSLLERQSGNQLVAASFMRQTRLRSRDAVCGSVVGYCENVKNFRR